MSESHVFLRQAIQQLTHRRDGSKTPPEILVSCDEALEQLQHPGPQFYEKIFEPIHKALLSKHNDTIDVALDCLSKLFGYKFWKLEPDSALLGLLVEAICNVFVGPESTEDRLQTQVIKAVTSAVNSELLHGELLLKAVRTVYNIFLLSKSSMVQTVAQAALSQIANTVFSRVPKDMSFQEAMKAHPDQLGTKGERAESIQRSASIESLDKTEPFITGTDALAKLEEKEPAARQSQDILKEETKRKETQYDVACKDAYLLFRAFCKLGMKPIATAETASDLRGPHMRTKLLSMYLVQISIKQYPWIFSSPAPILFSPVIKVSQPEDIYFVYAVRQFLCLVFTRNIVNVIPQVLDLAMDILGQIITHMRHLLKKEIAIIFTELIMPMMEGKTAVTFHQRLSLIKALERVLSGPNGGRILVEFYLNYDCDVKASAEENIWERLLQCLSLVMTTSFDQPMDTPTTSLYTAQDRIQGAAPALTTTSLQAYTSQQIKEIYSATGDMALLKKHALKLLVKGILQPLVQWCQPQGETDRSYSIPEDLDVEPNEYDDPSTFSNQKMRKQHLQEGIKRFNIKYKKGIKFLLDSGCIPEKTPQAIAHFLLNTEGLNKNNIGEYLGEGEEENIQIMHCFVDLMDFTGLKFVEALRQFLQSFRLPGEAQKIDRFMLKFAAQYCKGNPEVFASADTGYVLAYSVIMLNTDQHNPQVKKRMTKQDFIKNNRGIDEGKDLPLSFLEAVFDEIAQNEIKLKDEEQAIQDQSAALPAQRNKQQAKTQDRPSEPIQTAIKKYGATQNPELLDHRFNMSSRLVFYAATQTEHVKPMFQLIWMSCLMCTSSFLQKSEETETINIALDGFKAAIHICSIFDLELERKGFLSNLAKFVNLEHLSDIRPKNVESAKIMLEMAHVDGDFFGPNWQLVVKIMSQIDKLTQQGLPERDPRLSGPELKRRELMEDCFEALTSQSVTLLIDRIFSQTPKLKGPSIVELTKALCEMSWDEIISSSDQPTPRMYSLQRLVEIGYYNMKRIRVEWTQIWMHMGPHLNQVSTHQNPNVGYFALDKLKQLSLKFLELNELPNFKFQRDFLRPFEYCVSENSPSKIKDMALTCMHQIVQQKSNKLKSGWKAVFTTIMCAAREQQEQIVSLGFSMIRSIEASHLYLVLENHCLVDFVACVVCFCKNVKFGKIALDAIDLLKKSIINCDNYLKLEHQPSDFSLVVLSQQLSYYFTAITQVSLQEKEENERIRIWLPLLFGFYECIVVCDIEVRTRALGFLFDTLKLSGNDFSPSFWKIVFDNILDPIFADLKPDRSQVLKFDNQEDYSVWINTTLIQALKQLLDLFTHHFQSLSFMLDQFLDLLSICMIQENEALARVGSDCLVELVKCNIAQFNDGVWDSVVERMVNLFETTLPLGLYFALDQNEELTPFGRQFAPRPERKDFQAIIVKCVLHLLVIDTFHAILSIPENKLVYESFSSRHLFKLGDALYFSYSFAKSFNANVDLRKELHRMGFMKQVPNLLKQETSSVASYIILLFRIYSDPTRQQIHSDIEKRLIPLCHEIMDYYSQLDPQLRSRNLQAWYPVVLAITRGFTELDQLAFRRHIPYFYLTFTSLLRLDLDKELMGYSRIIFERVGLVFELVQPKPAFEMVEHGSLEDLSLSVSPPRAVAVTEKSPDEKEFSDESKAEQKDSQTEQKDSKSEVEKETKD
ncbi:hypothetical protein EDD86DRAFT_229201 [Gorgonomyces haynaldii]|nr:hypothetical protein EDD86DRAFT_229201 [Gorgonomyces haynaldii]